MNIATLIKKATKTDTIDVKTAYHAGHVAELDRAIEHLITLRAIYIDHAVNTSTANSWNDPAYDTQRRDHIDSMNEAVQGVAISMKDVHDYVQRNLRRQSK